MAVATNSRAMKQIIVKYLHETADEFSTEFRLHDFGFRGVSSIEVSLSLELFQLLFQTFSLFKCLTVSCEREVFKWRFL